MLELTCFDIDADDSLSNRRVWADAYGQLSAADGEAPLDSENLELLAVAAFLVRRDDDSAETWERAHHASLQLGDVARAARPAPVYGSRSCSRTERGGRTPIGLRPSRAK